MLQKNLSLPCSSSITIYKSFIKSHLDYSNKIYDKPNNVSFSGKFKHDFVETVNPLCSCSLEIESLENYFLPYQNYVIFCTPIHVPKVQFRDFDKLKNKIQNSILRFSFYLIMKNEIQIVDYHSCV